MSLSDYVRILSRRGWIILLLALLTAASAYVFSRVQTPIYKSTALVSVQPARPDFGLTNSARDLLRSYVSVIDTDTFAQKVIEDPDIQLDVTASELRSDVTIASDASRFIIQIDVENQDLELANRIAQKWAELLVDWRKTQNQKVRQEDYVDAILLDPPRATLDSPQTRINLLAGSILGALLGGVIVFVLEYLEAGILRSPQDVERALSLSVLGAIPAGKAQG
jgi:capsular polysaccharide biosynthesis protein